MACNASTAAWEAPRTVRSRSAVGRAGFVVPVDEDTALQPPAPLTSADETDADVLTDTFGEYVSRSMYSRAWQHRQAAVRYMQTRVADMSPLEGRQLVKYVAKGLQDKVAAVVTDSAVLLRHMVQKGSKLAGYVTNSVFTLLAQRLGDGNSRIAVRIQPQLCRQRLRQSDHAPLPSATIRPCPGLHTDGDAGCRTQ
jgi:hypothetical protein